MLQKRNECYLFLFMSQLLYTTPCSEPLNFPSTSAWIISLSYSVLRVKANNNCSFCLQYLRIPLSRQKIKFPFYTCYASLYYLNTSPHKNPDKKTAFLFSKPENKSNINSNVHGIASEIYFKGPRIKILLLNHYLIENTKSWHSEGISTILEILFPRSWVSCLFPK